MRYLEPMQLKLMSNFENFQKKKKQVFCNSYFGLNEIFVILDKILIRKRKWKRIYGLSLTKMIFKLTIRFQ